MACLLDEDLVGEGGVRGHAVLPAAPPQQEAPAAAIPRASLARPYVSIFASAERLSSPRLSQQTPVVGNIYLLVSAISFTLRLFLCPLKNMFASST